MNSIGQRGGVDRLQFVRRDYDALISQVWDPVTNDYVLPEVDITNSAVVMRHFQRRVPRPDLLFTTANFANNNTTVTWSNTVDNLTESFTLTVTGLGESLAFLEWVTMTSAGRATKRVRERLWMARPCPR